jgi:archaellum component FlaC
MIQGTYAADTEVSVTIKELNLRIDTIDRINAEIQEATQPTEHGADIDKNAQKQMRVLRVAEILGLSLDETIPDVNEKYSVLAREINERQRKNSEELRSLQRRLAELLPRVR